jgi:ABC-type cobalamin/Fe3+-siderophores transport system ATPase subunit
MSEPASASSSGAGLTARNLACIRGGRLLFSGLELALRPGGVILLTGPNGVGKSSCCPRQQAPSNAATIRSGSATSAMATG